jgi:hypothetical protein
VSEALGLHLRAGRLRPRQSAQQQDLADAAYLIVDGHAEVILAHPKGAVYGRCAEIPDYCRLDNAGIGRGGSAEEKQNAVSD